MKKNNKHLRWQNIAAFITQELEQSKITPSQNGTIGSSEHHEQNFKLGFKPLLIYDYLKKVSRCGKKNKNHFFCGRCWLHQGLLTGKKIYVYVLKLKHKIMEIK